MPVPISASSPRPARCRAHRVAHGLAFVAFVGPDVCSAQAAAKATAPSLSSSMASASNTLEYVSGLLLVFIALGVFAFVLKRIQINRVGGPGALRIEASVPLGGKERLMIVVVEGERLLIGVAPGAVQLVKTLRVAEQLDQDTVPVRNWLARALDREAAQ